MAAPKLTLRKSFYRGIAPVIFAHGQLYFHVIHPGYSFRLSSVQSLSVPLSV